MAAIAAFIFSAPLENSISNPSGESLIGVGGMPGTLGIIYGWDGDAHSHDPIVVPDLGTAYSWAKYVGLVVQGATDTNITNRQIAMGGLPPAGMSVFWQSSATFPNSIGPVAPTNSSFGEPPGDFSAEVTSSPAVYDGQSAPAVLGRNGNYLRVALAVSSLYNPVFGEPTLSSLPPLILSWDETA